MPPVGYCVCSALRRCHPPIDPPPLCAETSAAPSPPVPRGPRSGRAVLSRPSMLGDLIRQSGELPAIFPAPPVIGRSLTFKGHILSVLLTFRTFAAVLSRIAVLNTPGDPMRALLSSFRIGSGHRVIRTPLASPTPRKSAPCGKPISTLHPFAFATALLFARPLR